MAWCMSDKCILVTDAMAAMGLEDGRHALGEMKVLKNGERVVLEGTDTLAGSAVSLDYCLRKFIEYTKCSIVSALQTITLNPAQLLKLNDVGSLEVGAYADLVLLERENLEVKRVWKRSKEVYRS